MAKCKHCGQKKGKRLCPALDGFICAQCCATHRLQDIQCPADCTYLQSEFYQQGRRNQKARSKGKMFIEIVENNFHSEAARGFAFMVQADIYWWCSMHGKLPNLLIAEAMESACSGLAIIPVVQDSDNPLADFLGKLLNVSSRYESLRTGDFKEDSQRKALEKLAAIARNHEKKEDPEKSNSFLEVASSYFDQLDFEADLDYSPLEEMGNKNQAGAEEEDKPGSGLIIPGQ